MIPKSSLRAIGDLIGQRSYLGSCGKCGKQFMSRLDRAIRVAGLMLCERCAGKVMTA